MRKMYGIWKGRILEYGMEDFKGYGIWKIFVPFHSIACLVTG